MCERVIQKGTAKAMADAYEAAMKHEATLYSPRGVQPRRNDAEDRRR